MNQQPSFLSLPDRKLAYQQRRANCPQEARPSVVFLGGFASDMTGTKATFIANQCEARGYSYLLFDYRGHGLSSGRLEEGCIGDWLDDSLKVFDALTTGPQLVVGSSMGGWIGLLLAKERRERVAGFVGLAAAPDFTEDMIRPVMTPEQEQALETQGFFYENTTPAAARTPITRCLMEDGKDHCVFAEPFPINGPVRLIQGQRDLDVPWKTSLKLMDHIQQDDMRLTLIKDADHRLSREQDLSLIWGEIESLLLCSE
ncbi:MAG: alpha/beta hydrolase [Alphaproteobacteria bacterium]|nr:alpha/beta hydrolase [Alphaproteobacteria bacterium]